MKNIYLLLIGGVVVCSVAVGAYFYSYSTSDDMPSNTKFYDYDSDDGDEDDSQTADEDTADPLKTCENDYRKCLKKVANRTPDSLSIDLINGESPLDCRDWKIEENYGKVEASGDDVCFDYCEPVAADDMELSGGAFECPFKPGGPDISEDECHARWEICEKSKTARFGCEKEYNTCKRRVLRNRKE